MKKHWLYLRYVLRHKWFVFLAGLHTGAPIWRLIVHDWTKFLPREWGPYVENFYGPDKDSWVEKRANKLMPQVGYVRAIMEAERDWPAYRRRVVERFERAWNHHQKANRHHWQYWVMFNDQASQGQDTRYALLPMPMWAIREMVADWMGAGRAITGKWEATIWYAQNEHDIILNSRTRSYVVQVLNEMAVKMGMPFLDPTLPPRQRQGTNKGITQIPLAEVERTP